MVLSPTRLVLSEGSQGKLVCRGINVINASYAWLRNGELVRESSPSLHAYGSMLVVPFAYLSVTDNYTCIVNDSRGKLKATTTIEVFHGKSLNYVVLQMGCKRRKSCVKEYVVNLC